MSNWSVKLVIVCGMGNLNLQCGWCGESEVWVYLIGVGLERSIGDWHEGAVKKILMAGSCECYLVFGVESFPATRAIMM